MERSMRAIFFPSEAAVAAGRPGATTGVLAAGLLTLGLGLGLVPATAQAAGYVNSEQSPAGVGLAGAMTARADDASAIFYNPAGLGFQSGLSIVAGITLASPQQSVTSFAPGSDPGGSIFKAQSANFVLPTIYAAARVSDQIALGLGVFVHHGGGADFQNPDDPRPFPGRFAALRTNIQSLTFNPTLSIRIIPEVSVGGGLDIEVGSLEIVRSLALGSAEGRIALAGSSLAFGGNIGALVRLLDGRLNFGLSFRSALNLRFDSLKVGATAPDGVSLLFPYTQGATNLPTPHTISLGIAGKPARWLTISVDAISSLWSAVHDQRITLSDGGSLTQTSVIPRSWRDAYSGRIGVELDLGPVLEGKTKFWPKVRVGFGYDQSPVPPSTLDTSVPDADRFFPSLGVSLGYRGLGSIELGYTAILFRSQPSENPNLPLTYDTTIHVFGAAINLQLERVFGKRSAAYSARLLDRSPAVPVEEAAPAH